MNAYGRFMNKPTQEPEALTSSVCDSSPSSEINNAELASEITVALDEIEVALELLETNQGPDGDGTVNLALRN